MKYAMILFLLCSAAFAGETSLTALQLKTIVRHELEAGAQRWKNSNPIEFGSCAFHKGNSSTPAHYYFSFRVDDDTSKVLDYQKIIADSLAVENEGMSELLEAIKTAQSLSSQKDPIHLKGSLIIGPYPNVTFITFTVVDGNVSWGTPLARKLGALK